ncbi:MAG: SpoIIE family protein phosphatase [Deltaproteobacteria bacterium]|jgi:sigma-B regulation protein RsbU (phosphoserine phosphatase)|nr:SpoIIE family protein phosphatase [Deltaproteobacteria bacterium]MBW2239637.1 SpoIIE family protein phosphatase [Deltaproteobacteria bacterium]
MKLRWKYFIVFLMSSLVPLVTVTWISQKASETLGESISSQARQTLTETVSKEMVFATENYARITRQAKSFSEFALQVLAKEAERILILPSPIPPKIYFADDFDDSKAAPEDLTPSLTHMKLSKDGQFSPKPISYNHPNFLTAPGVARKDVRTDIDKFTRLIPTLKNIAHEFGDELFWIYASLESGVHISYPGHGGYPENYDPRVRPWYIRAKKKGSILWGPPIVDATTKQLTFTVSAPFFKPNGSLAGVAAIDVLIPHVLLESEISSQWSESMHSFLVGSEDIRGSGEKKLWVLSQKKKVGIVRNPNTGLLLPEENSEFHELIRYSNSKKSGYMDMPHQGVDSFWAFATIFPDLHFVIVVPKSVVMDLPENIAEMFLSYTQGQAAFSITAVVLALVLVTCIVFFTSRASTRRAMKIVGAFRRLAQGDFSVRLNFRLKDERNLMVTTFNEIVPKLEEHLRMSTALGVAQEVQQSLLPKDDPALQGFDISGSSVYCDETGGDYYDFIDIDQDRIAVVVGDVSGHGVSSALLMATARALIMLRASMPGQAAEIINDVNKQLSLDSHHTGDFMTFFYCELTWMERKVCWVRAGHDPALLYDSNTGKFDELKGHGLALGVDYTFEYDEFNCTLAPGNIVLIGTDGIWEMQNESGEMFGKDRLKEIIHMNASSTAKEIIAAIYDALNRYRGTKQPEDDITMVVIKVQR